MTRRLDERPRGGLTGPLSVAVLLVGLVVTGLLLLGRTTRSNHSGSDSTAAPSKTSGDAELPVVTPRHALPADAWAIIDVDLGQLERLQTPLPESLGALDCDRLAPPRHIAVALLAPARASDPDDLQLLVAATEATPAFQACARRRMLEGGARSETWPGGYEVSSRPGGLRLLLQPEQGRMVFANASSWGTDELVELLAGTRPNAARHGHHSALLGSISQTFGAEALAHVDGGQGSPAKTSSPGADASSELTLTLALPKDWVEGLVPPEEAARSPLRFLRASAWALGDEGLHGLVDCQATQDGSGRDALARFLEDARDDLLSHVPEARRPSLLEGWSLEATAPHRLELRWRISPETRARLLGRLLSGAF